GARHVGVEERRRVRSGSESVPEGLFGGSVATGGAHAVRGAHGGGGGTALARALGRGAERDRRGARGGGARGEGPGDTVAGDPARRLLAARRAAAGQARGGR